MRRELAEKNRFFCPLWQLRNFYFIIFLSENRWMQLLYIEQSKSQPSCYYCIFIKIKLNEFDVFLKD